MDFLSSVRDGENNNRTDNRERRVQHLRQGCFWTIGDQDKSFIKEGLKCMALNDS